MIDPVPLFKSLGNNRSVLTFGRSIRPMDRMMSLLTLLPPPPLQLYQEWDVKMRIMTSSVTDCKSTQHCLCVPPSHPLVCQRGRVLVCLTVTLELDSSSTQKVFQCRLLMSFPQPHTHTQPQLTKQFQIGLFIVAAFCFSFFNYRVFEILYYSSMLLFLTQFLDDVIVNQQFTSSDIT